MTQWGPRPGVRSARGGGAAGCLLRFTATGAVCLGAGFYMLNNWSQFGGLGKTAAVVLVILGTLVMIPVLLFVVVMIVVNRLQRRLARQMQNLGAQFEAQRQAYTKAHDFRQAGRDDYNAVDTAFYDRTRQALESAGFAKLGGIVDATVEQIGGYSPVVEVMIGSGGTTLAGFYSIQNPNDPSATLGICDITTEFSDGSFLITTNTGGLDDSTPPPQITRRQLPAYSGALALLEDHEQEKARIIAENPNRTCIPIQSMSDVLASEARQQKIKTAWRNAPPAELRQLTDGDEEE